MKNFVLLIIFISFISCGANVSAISEKSSSLKYGVIVPAYIYEGEATVYQRLIDSSSKLKENLIVIINPNSGPVDNSSTITTYNGYISSFHNNNSKVIGYVSTSYGSRSLSDVKTDIDLWISKYSIDGIFLDETSSDSSNYDYYKEIETYINSKGKNVIVNNFGTIPDVSYKNLNSIKIILETSYADAQIDIKLSNYKNWIANTNTFDYNAVLSYEANKSYYNDLSVYGSKWIYFTDDTISNPWDSLPSYYENLVDNVVGISE